MSAIQCPWWTAAKQLPWSADRVPMLPNDVVWLVDPWDGATIHSIRVPELDRTLRYRPFLLPHPTGELGLGTRAVVSENWYSTREALEAALAKESA